MRPRDLIINRPERQGSGQRYGYAAITLVFWILWLYLWLPLVSAVAWVLGARFFYHEMVVLEGYAGVVDVLQWYGGVIALIVVAMVAWMSVNLLRFGRGKDSRRSPRAVSVPQTARYFGIAVDDLHALRASRRLVVDLDAEGNVRCVELGFPARAEDGCDDPAASDDARVG